MASYEDEEEALDAPWTMSASLVVSDPRNNLVNLTHLAQLEPSLMLSPGDVHNGEALREHQWRLDTGADPRGALLEDHVESLADLLGDHLDTLAQALKTADPAHIQLEAVLRYVDEAPLVRLSPASIEILAQLRAGLKMHVCLEDDYSFLDED